MKIGSLCTGYGGLDRGVQLALGGETVWVSDIDKGANKILAHRYPDVPNLGDFTTTDWEGVEPVDVLTAGFPCQPVSHAGKRLGDNDERWLWDDVARAVGELRPGLVVLENVRGLLTAGSGRLFGRVLGALADLGYDAQWHGLRAADVGAPHGRWRVFIIAHAQGDAGRIAHGDGGPAADARGLRRSEGRASVTGEAGSGRTSADTARCGDAPADLYAPARSRRGAQLHLTRFTVAAQSAAACGITVGAAGRARPLSEFTDWPNDYCDRCLTAATRARQLLPTPRATDGTKGGPGQRGSSGDLMLPSAVALLPTPAVNDMGAAYTPEEWDAWTERMKAEHGNGNGHGKSLAIEAQRLLPTPSAIDGNGGPKRIRDDGRTEADHGPALRDVAASARWGDYAAAIARWEHVLGRPAPPPTQPSKKGTPQLSPAFVEWLMGLPAGWVTDVPGITRNEALKALGNGVVPQQCAAALTTMLAWKEAA